MPKTIVITGASSGIGKALAIRLAYLNHKVIAVARNKIALNEMHKENPNIIPVDVDLTKSEDLVKIKDIIDTNFTGIYLVHNAGVATPSFFAEMTEEDWDKHYLTNTKSVFLLTKLLLPLLKGGRVLNISTGLAHRALPGLSAYGITKAAIYLWKEYCNAELNKEDLHFGSAMPGIVDTAIQEKLRTQDSKKYPVAEMFRGFKERNELLKPEIVAKFLAWLLLDTPNEDFVQGDWDIYDTSHHQFWGEGVRFPQRK